MNQIEHTNALTRTVCCVNQFKGQRAILHICSAHTVRVCVSIKVSVSKFSISSACCSIERINHAFCSAHCGMRDLRCLHKTILITIY